MSLSVTIIAKDTDFDTAGIDKEIQYPFNEMFGAEAFRWQLWGHPVMKSIGCSLLYSLRTQNVYVYDADIAKLKSELETVLINLNKIAAQTHIGKNMIEFRINNALETVRIARKHKDKVGIAIG